MRVLFVNIILLIGLSISGQSPCSNGSAGGFPCNNVDLQSFFPKASMGSTVNLNDVWGWTDPLTSKEYALVGFQDGTAFVDVSDPVNPVYLGRLPTETFNSSWRDIKTIGNYAYIGADQSGNHGIQVFDLTRLRNLSTVPTTFTSDNTYKNIGAGNSHNVVALEESEHIVVVGGGGTGGCNGGLIFLDVSDPENPVRKGEFCNSYAHDALCFTYRGPDIEHYGKEICIAFNGFNGLTIIDASNTNNPQEIGVLDDNPLWRYTHQGWVSDDHKYLIINDELDERDYPSVTNTRTHVVDITNLDLPTYADYYDASTASIDHNLYVQGQYAFQANYRSGMRMLDIRNLSTANFAEMAFFDTYPSDDAIGFQGAWSVYPYFESGNLLVSDIQQGLFILKPTIPYFVMSVNPGTTTIAAGDEIIFNIDLKAFGGYSNAVTLSLDTDIMGATETFGSTSVTPDGFTTLTISNTDNLSGTYQLLVQARGPGDDVVHDFAISFHVVSKIYVDQSRPNSGNGAQWNTAFKDLQDALAAVPANGAEIWVATGTYFPTAGTDRSVSFNLPTNTTIYGGFSGSEALLEERNITINPTILSGNIGDIASTADNSYHVVTTSGLDKTVLLDGFMIQDGNANGVGNTKGGGLLNANFSTIIRNCTFDRCFASQGSAIYNTGANLTLENCSIIGLDAEMVVSETSEVLIVGEVKMIKD